MRVYWKSLSLNKHHHLLVKFAVAILLVGLAFRLFASRSKGFASDLESPVLEKEQVQEPDLKPPAVPVEIPDNEDQIPLGN